MKLAVILLVWTATANARPDRAPICNIDTAGASLRASPMAPNQDLLLGRKYTITSSYMSYIPSIPVQFKIEGPPFGGLLLYVSVKNSTKAVGRFSIPETFQNNDEICKSTEDSSITHTTGMVYTPPLLFEYMPPNCGENLVLHAIITKKIAPTYGWAVMKETVTLQFNPKGNIWGSNETDSGMGKYYGGSRMRRMRKKGMKNKMMPPQQIPAKATPYKCETCNEPGQTPIALESWKHCDGTEPTPTTGKPTPEQTFAPPINENCPIKTKKITITKTEKITQTKTVYITATCPPAKVFKSPASKVPAKQNKSRYASNHADYYDNNYYVDGYADEYEYGY